MYKLGDRGGRKKGEKRGMRSVFRGLLPRCNLLTITPPKYEGKGKREERKRRKTSLPNPSTICYSGEKKGREKKKGDKKDQTTVVTPGGGESKKKGEKEKRRKERGKKGQ